MAKKPRSQRRKKGVPDYQADNANVAGIDVLSEEHTIADSMSVGTNLSGYFDRDDDDEETSGRLANWLIVANTCPIFHHLL